jgi:TonB family protein
VNCKRSLLIAMFLCVAAPAFAANCEGLAQLKLPDTAITSAQVVAAATFVPPAPPPLPQAVIKSLPAFCRVTAEIKAAKDSSIKVEVWMPLTGWTGKYRGVGDGGFAGYIAYRELAAAVTAGYASASTDTGHFADALDASWALGHPDKVADFGYRAIHEMTVKAKSIIQTFYGEPPRRSYFAGCSNGGRQALMEAQRYPADYDGIVAGAPANYWTRVFAAFLWDIQAMQADPASYIGADKIPVIAAAVNAACDELDGVKDGVLNDPRACRFDPATVVCKQNETAGCLTAPQAAALKKIYAGPLNRKGRQMYPGFEPGGEEGPGGWVTWIGQAPGKDLETVFVTGFFKNMISSKESVDPKTVDIEAAVKLADEQQGRNLNADDPNLKPFAQRGGKLLMYHGWSDAALPPLGAIEYYNSVQHTLGLRETDSFMRLFMAPGVQHCGGGPGANSFGQSGLPTDVLHDVNLALEQWVEKGTVPEKIIATKYVNPADHSQGVKMTRPLCPYPQSAKYKGTGDTNDAANFECVNAGEVHSLTEPGVKPPRPLHTPEPKYAKTAKKQKIQGLVRFLAVIGVDGKVHDLKLVQSLEPSLDAGAEAAIEEWTFAPATKNGEPVACQMELEINYRLF